jgi:hypothetical protein
MGGMVGCMDEQVAAGEERAAQPEIQKQNKAKASSNAAVDPLSLAQDTVPVSSLLRQGLASSSTRLVPPSKIFSAGDALGGDSLGAQVFRVQLNMIDVYSEARRALAVAQEIFDQPVTLDYEVPYYKLRVGEFPTRREAEMYQQKARGAGYGNAWVMVATASAKQIEPLYHGADSTEADSTR